MSAVFCGVLVDEVSSGCGSVEGLDDIAVARKLDLGDGSESFSTHSLGRSLERNGGLSGAGRIVGNSEIRSESGHCGGSGSADGEVIHIEIVGILIGNTVDAHVVNAVGLGNYIGAEFNPVFT